MRNRFLHKSQNFGVLFLTAAQPTLSNTLYKSFVLLVFGARSKDKCSLEKENTLKLKLSLHFVLCTIGIWGKRILCSAELTFSLQSIQHPLSQAYLTLLGARKHFCLHSRRVRSSCVRLGTTVHLTLPMLVLFWPSCAFLLPLSTTFTSVNNILFGITIFCFNVFAFK